MCCSKIKGFDFNYSVVTSEDGVRRWRCCEWVESSEMKSSENYPALLLAMRIQEYKNFPVSNLDDGLHQNLTAGTLMFIPVSYRASWVNSDTVYPSSFE